jgi:cation diffusion facilitator CzcD-associated flavoprotein CzcO
MMDDCVISKMTTFQQFGKGPAEDERVNQTDESDATSGFDREAVHKRYLEERDKRLVEGRTATKDLREDARFAKYRNDPFTPFTDRAPVTETVDVVIVGAGIGGLTAGVELRKAGIKSIRMVDEAGGVGGTWYWNRYPGIMCDVESYIYIPMLDELDYVPKTRYAYGDEIREQLEALGKKFDLADDGLFHTMVTTIRWNEDSGRWMVRTDRGDEIRARYVVEAVGILNLMKMPDIPGMESFKGKQFHTARWDYEYTGGSPAGELDKLADRTVAILGTGASAVQAIPHLAAAAKHLYVFQRTPAAVGYRGNRPTSPEFAEVLRRRPRWQRERMYNFHDVLRGAADEDLVDDGWTNYWPRTRSRRRPAEMSLEQFMYETEAEDFAVMEEHRSKIDEIVADPDVAEALKPYYRYLCRRPLFLDEYYQAFNRPNVTVVPCPAGIDRVTATGIECGGKTYEFDLIVYATGFEAEVTPFPRRAAHDIVGRGGVTLADAWAEGPVTLHGLVTRGFPNLFIMPSPGQQAVVTVNFTLINVEAAEHIGRTVKLLEERGVRSFDVSQDAQDEYVGSVLSKFVAAYEVMEACTPSRLNNEGNPRLANPRGGAWGGGMGDLHGWTALLREWRESGDLAGLELDLSEPDRVSNATD